MRERKAEKASERALCLREDSGETVWTHEWDVEYGGLAYPYGPGPRRPSTATASTRSAPWACCTA